MTSILQKIERLGNVQVARERIRLTYDEDEVRILLTLMKSKGYCDRRKKKTISDLYENVIIDGKQKYGTVHIVLSWKSKLSQLKRDYDTYLDKLKVSGRSGDDDGLYEQPYFYSEMHELCSNSAKLCTPGASCSEIAPTQNSGVQLPSSSRKRKREAENSEFRSQLNSIQEQHIEVMVMCKEGLKKRIDS